MSRIEYQPDQPADAVDMLILMQSGPQPLFDPVTQDFLLESYLGLKHKCEGGGLLSFASFGRSHPWLYRLTFGTQGYTRAAHGVIGTTDRHIVALRFQPDYLRNADRFAMLRLIFPDGDSFHPNIAPVGAICVEIYPGEPLIEICHSLHDLFRWRLRQYDERDALNREACAWGRENVDRPIDDRPLFGRQLELQWETSAT